ncbi:hypothetical protein FRAAL5537 [Frankia alni ACN14a]|uniref:Uncharacterized protein n=1 Tax=Frankia alni (strain DSM 45986 / CECT 9034 / ACN14a) TaxID=326424 RepID=Q0REE0_FRAAA|nr:hypothetical protein FRAAL5537 [Frankia alni ACN14a]
MGGGAPVGIWVAGIGSVVDTGDPVGPVPARGAPPSGDAGVGGVVMVGLYPTDRSISPLSGGHTW